jgi:hypothetical protein
MRYFFQRRTATTGVRDRSAHHQSLGALSIVIRDNFVHHTTGIKRHQCRSSTAHERSQSGGDSAARRATKRLIQLKHKFSRVALQWTFGQE